MQLEFVTDDIRSTELFVGIDGDGERVYRQVAIDVGAQTCLRGMLQETLSRFNEVEITDVSDFEISEKYGNSELVKARLDSEAMGGLREIYDLEGADFEPDVFGSVSTIPFYFARFLDPTGNKIVAVRKSTQFKSLVSARGRLLKWIDQSLSTLTEPIFRLDSDFDFFVTQNHVFAVRPHVLAYICGLDDQARASAGAKLEVIQAAIPGLDLTEISQYVCAHTRAARLAVSIASRSDLDRYSIEKIKDAATQHGLLFREEDGKTIFAAKDAVAILEILDERRYTTSITNDGDRKFVAAARKRAE